MSSKFVFGVLVPAILFLAMAVFLKQRFSRAAPVPVVATAPAPAPKDTPEMPPLALPSPPVSAPVAVKQPTLEERELAIDTEKDRLVDWGMSSDPQSLSNILADLNSPEKEIRMAAIEAAKQFRSTNAIPVLKAAAVQTDDNEETKALLDAVDFLSLPPGGFTSGGTPLTAEQVQDAQQHRAQDDAERQAQMQQQQAQDGGGNPPSQPGNPPPQPPSQEPQPGQGQP